MSKTLALITTLLFSLSLPTQADYSSAEPKESTELNEEEMSSDESILDDGAEGYPGEASLDSGSNDLSDSEDMMMGDPEEEEEITPTMS